MSLITIEEKGSTPSYDGRPALFALGFRPFYLLAAAFAAVGVPLWVATQSSWRGPPRIDMLWHMHEMVFGFTLAVIVGFLYTAARNWTSLWTPRGKPLAFIAGLWVAGRIAMLAAPLPLAAAIDAAFLPVAAVPLYRVFKQSGNRRNMFLIALLGLLALSNVLYHGAALGLLQLDPLKPVHAAIMLVVFIAVVIGGRVIPMFTASAVQGVKPVQSARRDKIALVLTAAAGLAWACGLPSTLTAGLALAAAVAQALRLAGWKPWRTWRNPLLWILHVSYAWIPFGFVLLALAQFGIVTQSAAVHVLTVGALGGLIAGMITRTALGHTGRQLKAGRGEIFMFVMMQAAVLARFAASFVPAWRTPSLVLAAACWSASFVVYLMVYLPYLAAPRIDGREG